MLEHPKALFTRVPVITAGQNSKSPINAIIELYSKWHLLMENFFFVLCHKQERVGVVVTAQY
jgi:hypothetical protein